MRDPLRIARRRRMRHRAANALLLAHLLALVSMKVIEAPPAAVALVAALVFVTLAIHARLTKPNKGPITGNGDGHIRHVKAALTQPAGPARPEGSPQKGTPE